jgi:hypothetical protein
LARLDIVSFLYKQSALKESVGYMRSESFLARWNIYLNSHNDDVTTDANNAESAINPQADENSVDSSIAEVTQLNDVQVD